MPGGYDWIVESNGQVFEAGLRRFSSSRAGNLVPAMRVIKVNVRNAMQEVFKGGGRGLRSRWKSLSNNPWMGSRVNRWGDSIIRPGYRDWKSGKYADRPGSWWAYRGTQGTFWPTPLSLSGKMHESLTSSSRGAVWRSRRDGFDYGTVVRSSKGYDYPRAHAKGGGKLPKRDFLDWDMVGSGRALWTAAIFAPVQRYLRVGFESLRKFGYIDAGELIETDGPPARKTGGNRNG